MSGNLKVNAVQLGDSATASQNFVLKTNVDGTATLARGNVGETTQDILTINADGGVKVNTVPAFRAGQTSLQAVASGATVKVLLQSIDFDTNNNFADSRFTPTISGYYFITGTIYFATGATTLGQLHAVLRKNSVDIAKNVSPYPVGLAIGTTVNSLVYMNGSTDYIEFLTLQTGAASANTSANRPDLSYLSGYLVRAA